MQGIITNLIIVLAWCASAAAQPCATWAGIAFDELASKDNHGLIMLAQQEQSPDAGAGAQAFTSKYCDRPDKRLYCEMHVVCFYDNAGNLHHWVEEHLDHCRNDSWHLNSPPFITYVTGYKEIQDKQRAYNEWVDANSSGGNIMEPNISLCKGSSDCDLHGDIAIPHHIEEDGRLNRQTLTIPFYKKRRGIMRLWKRFESDCLVASGQTGFDGCGVELDAYRAASRRNKYSFPSEMLRVRAESILRACDASYEISNFLYRFNSAYFNDYPIEPADLPAGFLDYLEEFDQKTQTAIDDARLLEDPQ